MRSIKFPNMFNSNSTQVWKSSEYIKSTGQNTNLLLHCEVGELVGDPYFGLLLKHFLFNQNSYVLRDQLIDMIYTKIAKFIPQLWIERKDISVFTDYKKAKLYCTFKAVNQIDHVVNTYQLVLFDESESSNNK